MKKGDKVIVLSEKEQGKWYDAEFIEILPKDHMFAGQVHLRVKIPRQLTYEEQCFNIKPYIIQDWYSEVKNVKTIN